MPNEEDDLNFKIDFFVLDSCDPRAKGLTGKYYENSILECK